jgi:hypothetical protein
MLPNFLIIGAQKSASSFVHQCLREHPDVFMPQGEVRFFEDPQYLQSDISQFEELFRNVSLKKMIGIKRPNLLAKPECLERVHKHLPEAKLVLILRNPVDRAISAYFWYMKIGLLPIRPVEEGLGKIINGEYRDLYPRSDEIIDYGFYHRHIMRYLNYFDRNQMLIMLQRAFKVNTLEALRQVYRFLEIDDGFVPRSLNRKPKRAVYSLTRLRVLNMRRNAYPFILARKNDRTKLFYHKQTLSDMSINGMVVLTDRLLFAPICNNSKPKLSPNLISRLYSIYKEDIDELEDFLDQELTEWKV